MRIPSIHITQEVLSLVLQKVAEAGNIKKMTYDKLSEAIIKQAKNYSCNNRSISITNEKLAKKAKAMVKANKADAVLITNILFNLRKKAKHKGIRQIDQNHRDWAKIKELTNRCVQFCNEFGLSKREGFIKYLQIGLSRISSPRNHVNKLVSMNESISTIYVVMLEIEDDENAAETREIHDKYVNLISMQTSLVETFLDKPEKYVHFITVRQLTDDLNIPYDIYLKAQFFGLAWADSFPDPPQLVGDKAMERLNKYLFKNKIKIQSKTPDKKETLKDVLLKIRHGQNKDRD